MGDALERVLALPNLPTLPAAAMRVVELVQNPDVDIDEFAAAIETDPALTSRILSAANSSYYGLASNISTVPRAVMVLGLSTVRMLALGFTLVHSLRRSERGAFDFTEFWRRNLLVGVSARVLATRVQRPDPEEAFVAGLLSAVGVLGLRGAAGRAYDTAYAAARGDYRLLASMEREQWDVDHVEVGVALAVKWRLPASLVAAIGHSLDPDSAPASYRVQAQCVSLARLCAEASGGLAAGEAYRAYVEAAANRFGLDQFEADALFVDAQHGTAETVALFDMRHVGNSRATDLLERAHSALAELSLQSIEDQMRWRLEAERLADEVGTDSLTGIANRRAWSSRLNREVETAQSAGTQLSMLMVDVDHFKVVNDAHGHEVGDEVLRAVARVLAVGLRPGDFVARYGGDEFTVLMPGSTLRAATFVGERLRQAVEALDVRGPGLKRIPVTVSVGVASYGLFAEGATELLGRADVALYQAKATGRNRVIPPPGRHLRVKAA